MMMLIRPVNAVQGHSVATQASRADARPDLHDSTLKVHAPSVREDGTSEFNAPAAVCAIARPCGMVRHHAPLSPLSPSWRAPNLWLKPVKAPRTKLDLVRRRSLFCSPFLPPDWGHSLAYPDLTVDGACQVRKDPGFPRESSFLACSLPRYCTGK